MSINRELIFINIKFGEGKDFKAKLEVFIDGARRFESAFRFFGGSGKIDIGEKKYPDNL